MAHKSNDRYTVADAVEEYFSQSTMLCAFAISRSPARSLDCNRLLQTAGQISARRSLGAARRRHGEAATAAAAALMSNKVCQLPTSLFLFCFSANTTRRWRELDERERHERRRSDWRARARDQRDPQKFAHNPALRPSVWRPRRRCEARERRAQKTKQ